MSTIFKSDVDRWFTYHPPNATQIEKYQRIRELGKQLAMAIHEECPAGDDTTKALNNVREAVMFANASIACDPTQPAPRPE